MKKLVFGKPTKKAPKMQQNYIQTPEEAMQPGPQILYSEPAVKETVIVETRTVEVHSVKTQDKRARQYSKLLKQRSEEDFQELLTRCMDLAAVSESQGLRMADLTYEIQQLKQKPEPIPVVTKQIVVEKHVHPTLLIMLIASLVANALILLHK